MREPDSQAGLVTAPVSHSNGRRIDRVRPVDLPPQVEGQTIIQIRDPEKYRSASRTQPSSFFQGFSHIFTRDKRGKK